MNTLEYAEAIIDSKIEEPKDKTSKALLAHASIDNLRSKDFDVLRLNEYLALVEDAKKHIIEDRENKRKAAEAEVQRKVDDMTGQLWQLVKQHFVWWNPQIEKTVPLDGTLRWNGDKQITVLGSGGYKTQDFNCRADGSEVALKPILDGWIREYAAKLVQETAQPKLAILVKDVLRAFPFVSVHCPYADKLIHPKESCSIFTSGSAEVFHCDTIKLELRPI